MRRGHNGSAQFSSQLNADNQQGNARFKTRWSAPRGGMNLMLAMHLRPPRVFLSGIVWSGRAMASMFDLSAEQPTIP